MNRHTAQMWTVGLDASAIGNRGTVTAGLDATTLAPRTETSVR